MTMFQVDSEHVAQTAESARATADRLSADTVALTTLLTGLQSSWTGTASSAFQTALADWRSTQQVVEQSLAGIQQALVAAGVQYADVEQANARLFAR